MIFGNEIIDSMCTVCACHCVSLNPITD